MLENQQQLVSKVCVVAQTGYNLIMATAKDVVVRARVNRKLKIESENVLGKLGISTTEAIRMFLTQVQLHKGLPFEVKIPQADNSDILLSTRQRQKVMDMIYED